MAVRQFLHSIFQPSVFRTSIGRLTSALIAGLALTAIGSSANAASFSQLVVFGDSLSDAGNDLNAFGIPVSPYYMGRFSNGPVWVDQLATMLGLPDPTASVNGGTNYAYGGAETGIGCSAVTNLACIPNIGSVINTYLQGHTPSASQLFVVDGGGNNIRVGETNPQNPVTDLKSEITALATAGATSFLVPNLFPLGQTPEGLALADGGVARNLLVNQFNALLTPQLAALANSLHVTIYQVDAYSVFEDMILNKAKYGLTDVTHPAYPNGSPTTGGGGTIVSNPGQYLFWDWVHPTTGAYTYLADAAVTAIPEPTSLILTACGLVGIALAARRRRLA